MERELTQHRPRASRVTWYWIPADLLTLVGSLLLMGMAIGRQLNLEALSPTDLAFFHQSTWNAARGLGFTQTALAFEGQTLLNSVHLSLFRALVVPLYALLPSLLTLVALQALLVGSGAAVVSRLVDPQRRHPALAALASLAYLLHPWTLELALVDFRPLVALVPGLLMTVLGLRRVSLLLTLLGAMLCVAAREEGPWVLGALLPWVLWQLKRSHTQSPETRARVVRAALVWLAGVLGGLLLVWLLWGRLSNLQATLDPLGTLEHILAGERPLFRQQAEAHYGLMALLSAPLALLSPLLLGAAGLGWSVLTVFSSFEGVAAGGRGVHYLAVVHPLLLASSALGVNSALEQCLPHVRTHGRIFLTTIIAALILTVGFELTQVVRSEHRPLEWLSACLQPSSAPATVLESSLATHLGPEAGLLIDAQLAPVLAARPVLWIWGEFNLEQLAPQDLCALIDGALLRPASVYASETGQPGSASSETARTLDQTRDWLMDLTRHCALAERHRLGAWDLSLKVGRGRDRGGISDPAGDRR